MNKKLAGLAVFFICSSSHLMEARAWEVFPREPLPGAPGDLTASRPADPAVENPPGYGINFFGRNDLPLSQDQLNALYRKYPEKKAQAPTMTLTGGAQGPEQSR